MSSTTRQYFTSEDLNMLRRVMDNAGLFGRPDEPSQLARSAASRFLIACFQQGIATETELRFELFHHLHQDMSEPVRAAEIFDFQAWENEGGAFGPLARANLDAGFRWPGGRVSFPFMLEVAA